jgi:hypothetical protein
VLRSEELLLSGHLIHSMGLDSRSALICVKPFDFPIANFGNFGDFGNLPAPASFNLAQF